MHAATASKVMTRHKQEDQKQHLERSSWGISWSSTCPCLGLRLLNHLRNLVLEVLEPVLLIVVFMSPLVPLPPALSALPIAGGALPIVLEALPKAAGSVPLAAALGLPIGIASPAAMAAPIEAAGMVAPGLKADMVWPILLAEV